MRSLAYAGLLSFALASTAFAQGMGGMRGQGVAVTLVPLDAQETADLVYMREEEKLARDLYLKLDETWGAAVFANVARSEAQHFAIIGDALVRYAVPDPALPGAGLFRSAELQAMYDDLVSQGQVSLTDALYAGALVEEMDILDLTATLAATDHADLQRAYTSLSCGSRNHLRAFVLNLEAAGVVYEAQAMSQDEVDAILSTPMERCGAGPRRN